MLLSDPAYDLSKIRNPQLKKYAKIYSDIYENYLEQVRANGLDLDENRAKERETRLEQLRHQGISFRNAGKSLYLNWISPACEACRQGVGSVTLYISLMCNRKCYYCFNPNQEDYEHFTKNKRDCLSELEQLAGSRQKISHIALTGGEPLLHRQETVKFFVFAKDKFRRAHTRLYTSGDLLDKEILQELSDAGLDEIRLSVKMEDAPELRKKVYERMTLAKQYIPDVMVEMPVIPGTLEEMKELLLELDKLEIRGINLLEFCFPFNNVTEFRKRSFKIKNPPFLVLYNYWYAGGLPVAGSERECLDLLEFAVDNSLKLGVHYCSLENKHTAQVYRQNQRQKNSALTYLSPRDYFFKTAKVFGDDIPKVLKVFKKKKIADFQVNHEHQFLEFHIKEVKNLKGLDLEVGISSSILEEREDGAYLRELKVELTRPETFEPRTI